MSAFAEASSCIAGLFQATINQREQEEEQDQAVQYKYNTILKSITPEIRRVNMSCVSQIRSVRSISQQIRSISQVRWTLDTDCLRTLSCNVINGLFVVFVLVLVSWWFDRSNSIRILSLLINLSIPPMLWSCGLEKDKLDFIQSSSIFMNVAQYIKTCQNRLDWVEFKW